MGRFKSFSLYIFTCLMGILAFFTGYGILTSTGIIANASFEDTKAQTFKFQNKVMFLEFADQTLVALDEEGNFYKLLDSEFVTTGYQFDIKLTNYVANNDASFKGVNSLISYESNTLAVAGCDSTNVKVYYSTDLGKNWQTSTIGKASSVGSPITLISGNGYFALMTTKNIYKSVNGKDWELAVSNIGVDYNFSFSNGTFFRTEYSKTADPIVYYSIDLVNWNSFTSPVGIEITTNSYLNPDIAIVYANNAYFLFGFSQVYTSTNLSTWKYLTELDSISDIHKAVSYQNGALLCTDYYVYYADLSASGVSNLKSIISSGFLGSAPYALYANTIVESDSQLCVGFNGWNGYVEEDSNVALAQFTLYDKATKHTVKFVDYNGTVLSTVEVVDGQTVVAPANPTRTGYTFTSWDKDITYAITADTTFTAQYEINSYSVNFVDYNGQTLNTVSVTYGESVNESDIPTPTRTGYIFVGWDKDTTKAIASDTTFIAQYTAQTTLTIKYQGISGTSGLESQFYTTETKEKVIAYEYGSVIENDEFTTFMAETITPWINDYDSDSDYDYLTKFLNWDKSLPETITENLVIEAQFEQLHIITLKYYSQVRFPYANTDYHYPCLVYVQKEIVKRTGDSIDVNEFKLNYFEYEDYEGKTSFYNNLYNFEFLGWDKEFENVTESTTYTGQYEMPTVHISYYDNEGYLAKESNITPTLIPIEDISTPDSWSRFVNGVQNFFSLRWGQLVEDIIDAMDFDDYLRSIKSYSKASARVLLPFVMPKVNIPDYNSFFKNAKPEIDSKNMTYVDGDYKTDDYRFFVDTVAFSNATETLTMTIKYDTKLDASYKFLNSLSNKVFGTLGSIFQDAGIFLKNNWLTVIIVIVIVSLFIVIIKKPEILGLGAIKHKSSKSNNYNKKRKSKKRKR